MAAPPSFDELGSKELGKLLTRVTGVSNRVDRVEASVMKVSALSSAVGGLTLKFEQMDSRLGSEAETNNYLQSLVHAQEDFKKVSVSRALGLDGAIDALEDRVAEAMTTATGSINEARFATNDAVATANATRDGLAITNTALRVGLEEARARADANHGMIEALQATIAALERALPSAASMLLPMQTRTSALAASPPAASAAPHATALPSQVSQAPRSSYTRPSEPSTSQRASARDDSRPSRDDSRPSREGYRGAAQEYHNMSYKRSRTPPSAVEYPQKKRFIDPPGSRAPTLPPPARVPAPNQAPSSTAVMIGPISESLTKTPAELVKWVVTLLPTSEHKFSGDIVSQVRQGLHIRVVMTSAHAANRLVSYWDECNPLAGTNEMLCIRLATARDDAFTLLFGSGN